jgi:hypothetical protein
MLLTMIAVPPIDDAKVPRLSFASAVKCGRTALWSKGRSIILVVDGREHEFVFHGGLTEAQALAVLKARGLSLLREEAPGIAVLLTAIACMLVLVVLFLLR